MSGTRSTTLGNTRRSLAGDGSGNKTTSECRTLSDPATQNSQKSLANFSESSLLEFIEGVNVPMHSVGGDGTILWANQAELDLLGYPRDEYIGHNITEFHADEPVISDMLVRLISGESLRAFPARLRRKDGSIRHVLIDSSALFQDGTFVHTRCITRDVTREWIAERRLRAAEKWYRGVLDSLPIPVYTTDAEGYITDYNQEASRFAGRSVAKGQDRWCVTQRLYRPDGTFLPAEECPMAVTLRTGEPVRGVEAIAERPDGTRIHFVPYPTLLKDESGRIVGGVNVLVDITERKQAEATRARLAAIVATSDDAIIGKNLEGIILTWNQGAQRIFGYTAEEAIGQSVTMLMPPDHVNEEPAILDRIRRGERIKHYETVRRRKDGSLLDISLTVSPIFDDRGVVVGASKIARDITERKRAEAELRRANADLEQFAYLASHDLQEPIRNVSIYAELLERRSGEGLNAKGKECLAFIQESAARMNSLVRALLTYLQNGERANSFEDVNTATALANALANLAVAVQESGAVVTHGTLPVLRMSNGQMEHVFQNLISNAIKYSREGEAPHIHVSADPVPEGWRFSVKDNGIGIAPQYQDRIFGMFKRLHDDSRYVGAGVGLAMCQRIVERHGGRIWVQSEGDGKGSTFYFILPATETRQ